MEENNTSRNGRISKIENKVTWFTQKTVFCLAVIGIIGLVIRLYYLPHNVPLILDASLYFRYALDVSILGHLPHGYTFVNNSWPLTLSVFFSFVKSNNLLDYMNLQRLLTAIISLLTIIPVYILCRRFFDKNLALVGAALFAFEPRMIQNSLLGLTDSLFVCLIALSLALFFSTKINRTYLSFIVIAFLATVRYEGILLIFPFTIMHFIRFRKENRGKLKTVIAVGVFFLVLIPILTMRAYTIGDEGVVSSVVAGPKYGIKMIEVDGTNQFYISLSNGAVNLVKYLAWISIPTYVFFIPIGILLIFKNRDHQKTTIILVTIVLLIPGLYSYFRGIQETRYLLVIMPVYSLLSLFTFKILTNKISNPSTVLIIIVGLVLLFSMIFLGVKADNAEHEREAYGIAKEIITKVTVVNDYYPESLYLHSAFLSKNDFPIESNNPPLKVILLSAGNFTSLNEFIEFGKKNRLDHLVLDGIDNRPKFLNDVYYNETKYPFLEKIYDSANNGYKYRVKVFSIDYSLIS